MAKYRPIKTCFWSDEFISSLSPNAKLLYLYFITNERTSLCGIYRLPIRYISFETSLNQQQIEKAMTELSVKIEYKNGWIVIKNYQKHQTASPKIKEGIKREMSEIPQEIANLRYPIDTLSIPTDKPILKLEPELKLSSKEETREEQAPQKIQLGEFKNVYLLEDELQKLNTKYGVEAAKQKIESLSSYIASKGKKYKSHYATILMWSKNDPITKPSCQPSTLPSALSTDLPLRGLKKSQE